MDRMAGNAGNRITGVARFEPADMRGLIAMAGQASLIDFGRGDLRGIADVSGRKRFDVITAGPVA